jgi:hypothetical protein
MENNSIQYTVIDFQNKFAILTNAIFGEIKWPIKKLPDNIEIGQTVTIGANQANQKSDEAKYHNQDIKNLLQELIE